MQNFIFILILLIVITIFVTDLIKFRDRVLDLLFIQSKLDLVIRNKNASIVFISKKKLLFKYKGRFHEVTMLNNCIKLRISKCVETLSKPIYVDYSRFDDYITHLLQL